jgi:hypothetical protein
LLESNLINQKDAFDKNCTLIYNELFNKFSDRNIIDFNNPNVVTTIHQDKDRTIVVALNYSGEKIGINITLNKNYKLDKIIYGNNNYILPWDGVIISLTNNN